MIKYGQIFAVADFLETDNRGEDGFVLAYSAHALITCVMHGHCALFHDYRGLDGPTTALSPIVA